MPRLAIVSLGTLGGELLEASARRSIFDDIVVATRNIEHARRKVNNARVGAALEGRYPALTAVHFDMHAPDAGSRLADLDADVVFAAPSMLPWWRLNAVDDSRRDAVAQAPFGAFLACHLSPMLALQRAWSESGARGHWVGASAPDVVNHVLGLTGVAPVCGTGNVAEAIPKVRFILGEALELPPADFDVRLVAQHAFEYFCYAESAAEEVPPYLLQATLDDRDFTGLVEESLFEPFPIPYELDFNQITVSATLEVLEGLCQPEPVATHAPAPGGRLGGYPVLVSSAGVELNLPADWEPLMAEGVNRDSLPYDGIEDVDGKGTVWFTDQSVAALERIVGRQVDYMTVEQAPALARELVDRLT